MTTKLGILADAHCSSNHPPDGTLLDKVNELNSIGADLNWLLGDCFTNLTSYSMNPCATEYENDIEGMYSGVKDTMEQSNGKWVASPGNHDIRLDLFTKLLDDLNTKETINGLRFLTPNNEHRNNDNYLTESGNMRRWAKEEVYAHLPPDGMKFLEDEMDSDSTIPTFVGFHESPIWTFPPSSDPFVTRQDCNHNHQMCQKWEINYWCFDNRSQIRSILESGNVVAVFFGHLNTTGWTPYEETVNSISYIPKPHGGWFENGYLLWVELDESAKTGTVYWRDIGAGTDSTICSLGW